MKSAKKKVAVTGIVAAGLVVGMISTHSFAASLPEFYGIFVRSAGALIDLSKVTDAGKASVRSDATIIIHDKMVALASDGYVLRAQRLVHSEVRITLRTGAPSVRSETAVNEWIDADPAIDILLRSKPVKGEAEMVELVAEKPIPPGVYRLRLSSGMSTRSLGIFSVEFGRAKPESVDRCTSTAALMGDWRAAAGSGTEYRQAGKCDAGPGSEAGPISTGWKLDAATRVTAVHDRLLKGAPKADAEFISCSFKNCANWINSRLDRGPAAVPNQKEMVQVVDGFESQLAAAENDGAISSEEVTGICATASDTCESWCPVFSGRYTAHRSAEHAGSIGNGGIGLKGDGTKGRGTGASGQGGGVFGKGKGDASTSFGGEETVVMGSLDPALIDAVLKRHAEQIKYCYERELPKKPNLAGKLVVNFTIASDGLVTQAKMKSSTMSDNTVEGCVAERFLKLRFPQPKGGGVVNVNYPLLFTNSSGEVPAR